MSREKDLIKNTVVLGAGRFIPTLMTFVTLPILSEQLTKAEYGTYDLITTLIMLVIPIATLQIQSAAFRFLIENRGDREGSSGVISNIFIVTVPVSVLAAVIVQFFFPSFSPAVRLSVTVYFILDTIYLTLGQTARGLGNNKDYAIGAIMLSVINMLGVAGLVKAAHLGLEGVYLALIAANLTAALFVAWKTKILSYISLSRVSGKKIRELLNYSWPMVPNNLSTWVLKLSDRLVITAFLGVEANAVYAIANKVPNVLSLAQSIMVMAWQENASIAVGDADAEAYYSRMFDFCFNFMAGATAVLIAATPILFRLLIRGDYADAYFQMPVLILAMFFFVMSSYFGGIYIAYKKTTSVGITTMVAAVINLTIDLCFVRAIGITAGSVSTLAAYLVLYIYRMLDVQKFQKVALFPLQQVGKTLIITGMLVLCFLQRTILNALNIFLGLFFFVLFNRKLLANVISAIRKKI